MKAITLLLPFVNIALGTLQSPRFERSPGDDESGMQLVLKVLNTMEDVGGLKANVQTWQVSNENKFTALQSQLNGIEEEIKQMRDNSKAELAAFKTAMKEELMSENSRLKTELSEVHQLYSESLAKINSQSLELEQMKLGLSNTGLDQCQPEELATLCKGMRDSFEVSRVCPAGWLQYPGSTRCIKGFDEPLDFHAASQHCKGQGRQGNLVSIHSPEQHKFLASRVVSQIEEASFIRDIQGHLGKPENIWVGLNDLQTEGQFEWTDGTSLDLLLWNEVEPNNKGLRGTNNSDCVRMWRSYEYLWADTECEDSFAFICQMEAKTQLLNSELKSRMENVASKSELGLIQQQFNDSLIHVELSQNQRASQLENNLKTLKNDALSDTRGLQKAIEKRASKLKDGLNALRSASDRSKQELQTQSSELRHDLKAHSARLTDTQSLLRQVQQEISEVGMDECQSGEVPKLCEGIRKGFTLGNEGCRSGWLSYPGTSNCVKGFTVDMTYDSASQHCKAQGRNGNLVSIHTRAQQDFLKSEIALEIGATLWIGLNDIQSEGQHKWTDASGFITSFWKNGQPEGDAYPLEDCICMLKSSNYLWHDLQCIEKHFFICQVQEQIPLH